MKKTEKILMLANSIVMLETAYSNTHDCVLELARRIANILDGNPNFCQLCAISYKDNPEKLYEIIKKELSEEKLLELPEYKPF